MRIDEDGLKGLISIAGPIKVKDDDFKPFKSIYLKNMLTKDEQAKMAKRKKLAK